MKIIQIEILKPIEGFKVGDKVRVRVHGDGTPINVNWRRRFIDQKTDDCFKVLKFKRKLRGPKDG